MLLTKQVKAICPDHNEYDPDNYAMCFHIDFGVVWNMA
jgi:hypothetical protein